MKNIKRTLWIAIVVGAFTLSAFAVDLVPTSESLLQKVEKKNEVRTELPQAVKSAVIGSLGTVRLGFPSLTGGTRFAQTPPVGRSENLT